MTEEERLAAEAAQREADVAAAAEAARVAAEQAAQQGNDETAAELARLRQEAEDARTALARYDGIDPDVARRNAEAVAAAETARRAAELAQAEAEGNFQRLRELQNEEAAAERTRLEAERDTARQEAEQARSALADSRLETAFANSRYLQDETILSGPKAQRLYGDHVEVENGVAVVFDKPKGEAKRAKVMDAKGNPLPFDQAIAKVIGADPDKDHLLKTKLKPGANSKTVEGKEPTADQTRHGKLAEGLRKLRAK